MSPPAAKSLSHCRSFSPLADSDAQILILGSMPGQRSLSLQQYYAHRQNQFWAIMGQIFDAGLDLDYSERVLKLQKSGVAVWDVLQSCVRPGSLDAAIALDSIVPNDFASFFKAHKNIQKIFFNGQTAAQFFAKWVCPQLSADFKIDTKTLPSTSPAHASLSFEQKLKIWRREIL